MALRVLLADESSTIKKVMQLTLQDYSVDVKAVPIGLDVLQIAQSYKPDIVFADVLLQKRSGYDVCADLKGDPQLKSTPVVLMWSGFMDLDEGKATACRADARLEKPFDAETLRGIVKSLVKKTGAQKISEYLSFPDLPDFVETAPPVPAAGPTPPQKTALPTIDPEPKDEFVQVPLTKSKAPAANEDWSHQDLSKFKIDLPEIELDEVTVDYVIPDGGIDEANFVTTDSLANNEGGTEQFSFGPSSAKATAGMGPSNTTIESLNIPSMDSSRIEEIVRTQAREIIESVVWKVIPDIAERVIREELEKILKESENKLRIP